MKQEVPAKQNMGPTAAGGGSTVSGAEAPVHASGDSPGMKVALWESVGQYKALYDNLPLMVLQLDREGNVVSVNQHGARVLGYASSELVGRSVLRLFHPEDRREAARQLRRALDFPQEVSRCELRKVRKDGNLLWVRETVSVVQAADLAPVILVVGEDVTERRQSDKRLAEHRDQLRKLNGELLVAEEHERQRIARMLHDELGQSLAAARIMICELRDSETSAARAERLEELRTRLDLSIGTTRSLTFRLSPPMLHDLGLAPALQALGERIEKSHGIRFVFALGEGWSPLANDVGLVLYRVVRELLYNVVKHAQASRVRLELVSGNNRIKIVVKDDGVGFAATAGPADGSLGLLLVRERMGRLGGLFEIVSAPGCGTRALLSLPIAEKVEAGLTGGRQSP